MSEICWHIEADRARAVADESHHTVLESTRDVRSPIRTPPLPRYRESEGRIDVYLQRFERCAANEGWERTCYATSLRALLEGVALDIYHHMPIDYANDYEALKPGGNIEEILVHDARFSKTFLQRQQ